MFTEFPSTAAQISWRFLRWPAWKAKTWQNRLLPSPVKPARGNLESCAGCAISIPLSWSLHILWATGEKSIDLTQKFLQISKSCDRSVLYVLQGKASLAHPARINDDTRLMTDWLWDCNLKVRWFVSDSKSLQSFCPRVESNLINHSRVRSWWGCVDLPHLKMWPGATEEGS